MGCGTFLFGHILSNLLFVSVIVMSGKECHDGTSIGCTTETETKYLREGTTTKDIEVFSGNLPLLHTHRCPSSRDLEP